MGLGPLAQERQVPLSESGRGALPLSDPFLRAHGKWIIRRSAADSRKIDIGTDLDPKLFPALFDAMGFDLGAVHAADKNARRIEPDLQSRNPDWLHDAAQAAEEAVNNDYREWRR